MRNTFIGMGAAVALTLAAGAFAAHAVLAPAPEDGLKWITPFETGGPGRLI